MRLLSILIYSLLFFLLSCNAFAQAQFTYDRAKIITSKGITIDVEVADTVKKRQQGLGFRTTLEDRKGMLFVFDERKRHSFWMKNTRMSLDIIWLDNYDIVHIEHNVPFPATPSTRPKVVNPDVQSNFVLELRGGQAKVLELAVGQSIQYQF